MSEPRFGIVFPSTQDGMTPNDIRDYVKLIESVGADHVLVADHVLGADPDFHAGWSGAWDNTSAFREPLILLGFVLAVSDLDVGTYVLIASQRQTALVAKQVTELDLLSGGGRVRLGIAVGWNELEYDGLGIPFRSRAARLEDQVGALRDLWSSPSVDRVVGSERIHGAGINPRPSLPVPIWMGGASDAALERVGRLGDGWMPFPIHTRLDRDDFARQAAIVAEAARDAGRDPGALGLQGVINLTPENVEQVPEIWADWLDVGATHIAFNTLRSGSTSLEQHRDLVARAAASFVRGGAISNPEGAGRGR